MLNVGAEIIIIDNSGAKKVKILKILGGSYKKYGLVGNLIVVSVKKINPKKKIKKGEIFKAVISSIKKKRIRENGSFACCDVNGAVILNNKKLPIATRILRPVLAELHNYNFQKLLSMSTVSV